MPSEQSYWAQPGTAFQACVNAVAYLKWYIDWRDETQLTMHIRTPFTLKDFSPTFQDTIDVEVVPNGNGSLVWVDSNPRFQLWNWGKDARNERKFLEEVSREIQRFDQQQRAQSVAQNSM